MTDFGPLPLDLTATQATQRAFASADVGDAAELRTPTPAQPSKQQSGATEFVVFWAFVAGLAWVPLLEGSNILLAWAVNALMFPGLAIAYELSLLVRNKSHPVALKEIWIAALLFAAVFAWIIIQNATWTPSSWHHPIWSMTADALNRRVPGSISVNRDLTTQALIRLITSASVFWLALQLCRSMARARKLIILIGAIAFGYAVVGLLFATIAYSPLTMFRHKAVHGYVSSTFYNPDNFATYAGIGLVTICGAILQFYREEIAQAGGQLRHKIGAAIEATTKKGAILDGGAFVLLVALLMTGSRGGVLATAIGLGVLFALWFGRRQPGQRTQKSSRLSSAAVAILAAVSVLVTVVLVFGDAVMARIAGQGLSDVNRLAVYMITLRSIFDAPVLGFGYGTFADVFPMFRDSTISTYGVWDQAHNTYLEVLQGLGLIAGAMLIVCVGLLAFRSAKGAMHRRKGVAICCIATAVSVLVGMHAVVDFSLQIQAVTLTFMAILGAGVAQSKSSRLATND